MAIFNKFNDFVEQIGLEQHELNADTLKVYLTNTQPVVTNTVFDTPAEIVMTNCDVADGGADILNTWSESPAGTGTLVGTDVVFTATADSVGPFQWVVLYNDTTPSKFLIGWYESASAVTLNDTETFTVNFGASVLTIT